MDALDFGDEAVAGGSDKGNNVFSARLRKQQ